jgi:hypothetical protein
MATFLKLKNHRWFFWGVAVLLSLIPLFFWYEPGMFYARGDVLPFWLSPDTYSGDLYLWSVNGTGAINRKPTLLLLLGIDWLFSQVLHLPIGLIQMLLYTGYIYLSIYAFIKFYNLYFLNSREIKDATLGAYIGSIIYTFNLFVFERSFYPTVRWEVAFFPLIGYFLLVFVKRQDRKLDILKSVLLVLVTVPLLILNPPLLVVLFILLIFLVLVHKYFPIKKLGLIVFFSILVTAWAIIPNYFFVTQPTQFNTEINAQNWSWTHTKSTILNHLLLNTSWAFQNRYYAAVEFYHHPAVLIILLLIPASAIFALLSKKRHAVFLFLFALIVILFSKGYNQPLEIINEEFYKLPLTYLFREPRKLMSLFMLPLILTAAFGLDLNFGKYKKTLAALSVLVIVISLYPFIKSEYILSGVLIEEENKRSETLSPLPDYLPIIKQNLPQETFPSGYNVLLLPYLNNYLARHKTGVWPTDEIESRFIKNSFIKTPTGYLFDIDAKLAINTLFDNYCDEQILRILNVRYIVNRKYILPYKDVVRNIDENYLRNCELLEPVYTDDDLEIYKNRNGKTNYIYAFPDLYSTTITFDKLPSNTNILNTLIPEFNFIKASSTEETESEQPYPSGVAAKLFANLNTKNVYDTYLAEALPIRSKGDLYINAASVTATTEATSSTIIIRPLGELASTSSEVIPTPIPLGVGNYTIRYEDPIHASSGNAISNFSFEDRLWKDKVGDCHNYDDSPALAMERNAEEKTNGQYSLQLEATRHIACTSIDVPVKPGKKYLFSFDYQSPNGQNAGYYFGFNDPEKTELHKRIPILNANWQTYEREIIMPEYATSARLYVYAYADDGYTGVITRYDNFHLVELPEGLDDIWFVSQPDEAATALIEPKAVDFEIVNPTKKLVRVTGATTPFYLAMSESYHDKWRLELDNKKVHGPLGSWWPFTKPDAVADERHFKLNSFLNGWYVDPAELCSEVTGGKSQVAGCTRNPDGSYDMQLVIEFSPQRWFYLGLIISGTTLLGCLGYLVFAFIQNRKN